MKKWFRTYYVECKFYDKKYKVGTSYIEAFNKVISDDKVKGIFVTTSTFVKGAYECAKKNNIKLIDGNGIIELLKKKKGILVISSNKKSKKNPKGSFHKYI